MSVHEPEVAVMVAAAADAPARPRTLAERLREPEAFLSRSDLRDLGLERRAIDAVFRACPVVALPGYSRPLIQVADYQSLIRRITAPAAVQNPTTAALIQLRQGARPCRQPGGVV